MSDQKKSWITVTESRYPWERDALDFVRDRWPDHDPYRAWANFEFIALDGSINEVDLLLLTPMGFFLVEVKSRPGRVYGDAGTWTWDSEGRLITTANPLLLANLKAKKLKQLLLRQKAVRVKDAFPFIEPLVFLSAAEIVLELRDTAAYRVCLRDVEAGPGRPERPGILAAVRSRSCPGLNPLVGPSVDRPLARVIAAIKSNPQIALIEQPEYKRRWSDTPWEDKVNDALHAWLLDRLESYFDLDGRMKKDLPQSRQGAKEEGEEENEASSLLCVFAALREVSLYSLSRVADVAGRDPAFQTVAALYRGRPDFDVARLVAELVEAESVPLLPVLRYKPSGRDKRIAWERTWGLQRLEDALDRRATKQGISVNDGGWSAATDDGQSPLNPAQAEVLKKKRVGKIDPPPKYKSADFQKGDYWRLRGGLDVPKERWLIFPHCQGPDGQALIAWAGYDHLQLAKAVAAHYVRVQEQEGGRDDPRLVPLLACLAELLPWLKQWHNDYDADYGVAMGDYYEGFVQDEARLMGRTMEQVRAWQPAARKTSRKAARP